MRYPFLSSGPLAAAGVVFGGFLAMIGFGALGAGHGSPVILWISTAPFSVPQILAILKNQFGSPALWIVVAAPTFFWAGVGGLLAKVHAWFFRAPFLVVIGAHYAAALFIVSRMSSDDWNHMNRVLCAVVMSGIWYILGQIGIWVLFFSLIRRSTKQIDTCSTTTNASKT